METTTEKQKKTAYTEAEFGKQHWSLLAYLETQVVDKAFPIDHRRMSCNTRRGITNGCGWDDKYSTANNKGEQLILGHDDIDCFEELEAEGFIKNNGTLLNMYPELTDKGWKCISQIREFKGKGGNYIDFIFKK